MKHMRHLLISAALLTLALAAPGPARAGSRVPTPSSSQFAKTWDARNFSHRLFDSLLRRHVKKGRVDYAGIRRYSMSLLREYLYRLANTRPQQLKGGKSARLAFWINVYNALVLRSKLYRGRAVPKARKKVSSAARAKRQGTHIFQVGGKWHSLAKIRDRFIRMRFKDPRALFALVGTSSGEAWLRARAYTGRKLTRRLRTATRRFISHKQRGVRLDRKKMTVWLPQLFYRYRMDFARPPYKSALVFVASHLSNAPDAAFIKANVTKLKVRYR